MPWIYNDIEYCKILCILFIFYRLIWIRHLFMKATNSFSAKQLLSSYLKLVMPVVSTMKRQQYATIRTPSGPGGERSPECADMTASRLLNPCAPVCFTLSDWFSSGQIFSCCWWQLYCLMPRHSRQTPFKTTSIKGLFVMSLWPFIFIFFIFTNQIDPALYIPRRYAERQARI